MSRFADPRRTQTLALPGGCQCPGSPHEADEWTYRTELGGSELIHAYSRSTTDGVTDEIVAQDYLLEAMSVSWNMLDDAGDPVPLTLTNIKMIDATSRTAMAEAMLAVFNVAAAPPPNGSAARSRNGSRASGSRTRILKTAS